ncbi:MAG TPA: LysR substrate-binding domain-containing protein [Azospirillaceae bacterium]|nr:LysR substrate-binding domain-containing protein [Azospirillaceae bacterium]
MRLPPFPSLRLFEAAGRHQSFRRAAEELNVTPSAVSHGVQSLEAWLGTPLFERTGRRIALTQAGRSYLGFVREAMLLLEHGTATVADRGARGHVVVSAAPTFGRVWLLPRLPAFLAAHPGLQVTVDGSRANREIPFEDVDFGIRLGKGPWPGLHHDLLARERLFPAVAPALAGRVRWEAGTLDLGGLRPILLNNPAEDWAAWQGATGTALAGAGTPFRVDTMDWAMEAAAAGIGTAIARLPLAAPALEAGRLVPVPGAPETTAAAGYWLVGARSQLRRPEIQAFRSWIVAEAARG